MSHPMAALSCRCVAPRVEGGGAGRSEVGNVAGGDGHTVDQGRRSDQGIAVGTAIWHVKRGAATGDSRVDRQDAAGECRQYPMVKPASEEAALLGVAPFNQTNADLKLQDGDCG